MTEQAVERLLAVDVGNSRVKFGLFEAREDQAPQILNVSALRLRHARSLGEKISAWIEDETGSDELPSLSIISGSNPPVRDELLAEWPRTDAPPRVVNDHRDIPIALDVDQPSRVGLDRLLSALAARHLVSQTQPLIVIDSGTATTVNLITSDGTFRGGAILPGLRLSAYALHDYTARLPLIDTDSLSNRGDNVDAPLPGRNTTDAIKSGLFWGQLGAVRELSKRMARSATGDFGETSDPILVLTGGGGRQLAAHLDEAVYVDCLTLHGLAWLTTLADSH